MKQILPVRFGIIQKVIIVLTVFAMSIVWPLGAFPVSHVSTSVWDGMRISGPSNENEYVRQEFSPNFEKLKSISVYVANDPDSIDTMRSVLRVYDYTGKCLSENYFQAEEYELPGFVTVDVNLETTPGILYFYTIGGVDGDLIVAYCGDDAKTAENGNFFYKEVPAGGTSIVTEYQYERPMGLKRILVCDAACLFAAVIAILLVGWARSVVFKKCDKEKAEKYWKRGESIVRYSTVGVTVAGVIVAFVGIVVKRLFTDDILNIVVLFGGTLIAAAYICYGVLICKSELAPLEEGEDELAVKLVKGIRTLLFAAVIIMCCMYQNGYTNYEKGLYLRRLLVFFGLFIISLGKRKQIINIPGAVWSVAAFVIGRIHVANHSAHIEHITTAKNEGWVIWIIGLMVIQIVIRIINGDFKKLKRINWLCMALALVFWILCIVFANGRLWPAVLCVVFTVWTLFFAMSDEKEKILKYICDGILVAFVGTVIFCLYRRPYQYFMLTRYGGIFFTATATAIYYVVPAAAALTKIVMAIRENSKHKVITGSALFGIVAAYIAFTASRTGIIAAGVMVLFALGLTFTAGIREFIKSHIKHWLVVMVSVLLTFVMTFSATRMIPAMAGNPFYFWYEEPNAYFTSETPWKGGETLSETYIDIRKTLSMLFERLFIGEEQRQISFNKQNDITPGALYASADPMVKVDDASDTMQYSNGRLEIFSAYIGQLNMNGHETMSVNDANGNAIMHAHNSYIQVAYDFGIPMGIVFLLLCGVIFIRSCLYVRRNNEAEDISVLPLIVVVGFGVASVFEWAYHIANPLGFVFLLMFAPLMMKREISR